jgi:hypothetical protein
MGMAPNPIDALLARLEGVRRHGVNYVARCPSHQDNQPSLSLTVAPDGKVLVHCFSGCETDSILLALGITWQDLFPEPRTPAAPKPVYASEYGRVVAEHVARARRIAERRERWADGMALADELREGHKMVATARALVTDTEAGWALEDKATALERSLLAAEMSAPWA